MKPILSVIVCTFNRANLLKKCLDALADQTLNKNKFEIVVINNNSTDHTLGVISSYEKYYNFSAYIEYNRGLNYARNRGWKESKGEYIAYIDDDAIAAPNWCEKILNAFFEVKPSPAAVGGRYIPHYDYIKPKWFLDEFEIREWGNNSMFLQPPRARFGFSGSNMAFPKSILRRYNGFSTKFGKVKKNLRMGEDTEFFYRIYQENPYFWYDPDIIVKHYTPKGNMNFFYPFKRNLNIGISMMAMSYFDKNISIKSIAKNAVLIIKLIMDFMKKIICLNIQERYFRTACFKFFGELGNQTGILAGQYKMYKQRRLENA